MEVDFNEESFTVNEFDGQVNVSLRITGKFFIPVYAIVEISDGTATGEMQDRRAWLCNIQIHEQQSIPSNHCIQILVYNYAV